jgi:hypothetical protein
MSGYLLRWSRNPRLLWNVKVHCCELWSGPCSGQVIRPNPKRCVLFRNTLAFKVTECWPPPPHKLISRASWCRVGTLWTLHWRYRLRLPALTWLYLPRIFLIFVTHYGSVRIHIEIYHETGKIPVLEVRHSKLVSRLCSGHLHRLTVIDCSGKLHFLY